MASTSWNGRKLWLKSQIGIMRINALVRGAAIPLPGVDFWYIFETQVLLSNFETWHAILNCWYLSLSEEENDNWDERSERAEIKLGWDNWQPPSLFKEEILKSWERIFDPELLGAHSEWIGGEAMQACIEKICVNEVIDVTYFKAR